MISKGENSVCLKFNLKFRIKKFHLPLVQTIFRKSMLLCSLETQLSIPLLFFRMNKIFRRVGACVYHHHRPPCCSFSNQSALGTQSFQDRKLFRFHLLFHTSHSTNKQIKNSTTMFMEPPFKSLAFCTHVILLKPFKSLFASALFYSISPRSLART